MEAKISHGLPSANWRSRKVSSSVHPKSEGLRLTLEPEGENQGHPCLGSREGRPSSSRESRRPFIHLVLFTPSVDWQMPTHMCEEDLYSVH